MNFIPGKVRANAIEMGEGVTVPMPRGARGTDGQPVIFGARPEHLSLASNGAGLPATVVVVEPTGADTQVFAKFGGADLTAVFRERHDFKPGETIRLVPDHERTHLFDAESGKSLKS
jgi:multiple sugar transport system ATP-binding protein